MEGGRRRRSDGPAPNGRVRATRLRISEPRGRDSVRRVASIRNACCRGIGCRRGSCREDSVIAQLLTVEDAGVLVKPRTRIAEPVRLVPSIGWSSSASIRPFAVQRAGAVAAASERVPASSSVY